MNARMMHLNLFVFGCGHHRGAWRHPHSSVERLGDIRDYEHLAQTAERGKLDAVFFADGHAVGNVADGSAWFLEPLTALAAMSRATERIGLISTVSSTFATPVSYGPSGGVSRRFCQLVEAETLMERTDSLSCPCLSLKQPTPCP